MKHLLALILATAFSGAAIANEDAIQIADYDTDDNGTLSREEVSSHEEISAKFDELDANADGELGEDELDKGPIDDFDEIGDDYVDEDDGLEDDGIGE